MKFERNVQSLAEGALDLVRPARIPTIRQLPGNSPFTEGVLDRLAHRAREPRFAHRFGRDPEMPTRRTALKRAGVDCKGQRKVSEDLFDRPRQPAPACDDRAKVG